MNTQRPKLEESSRYDLFLTNQEQRPIADNHVRDLAASMKSSGFLGSKPVQVKREGKFFRVIDGHHRLVAAKALGIKFYYVVETDAGADTMAAVNTLVRKWATIDFVRMYAVRGMKPFQEILAYTEKGVPVAMAASLLYGESAASGNALNYIKDGTLKVKDRSRIDFIVELIDEHDRHNAVVKHRPFIDALSRCLFHPDFDRARFRKKMAANPMMIGKASNVDLQLDQIEEVYNFHARDKWPLAFEVRKLAKERKANFGSAPALKEVA